MCLVKVLLFLVTAFCSSGIWSVNGSKRTYPPKTWIESSSIGTVIPGNEENNSPPKYTPAHQHNPPPHRPTQHPTVRPPHVDLVTIVDQFDHRDPDGSYEFRYQLTDDTVRYERGYFISYQYKNILVVKGYYSYRLPDLRYLTVFYTADQNGYRQDSSDFSTNRPQLPRSLNVQADSTADDETNSRELKSTAIDEE